MLGQQQYATGTHGQSADQVSAPTIDGEPDLQAGVRGSSPLSSTRQNTQNKIARRCPRARHVPDLPAESLSGCTVSWPSSLAARSLTAAAMARVVEMDLRQVGCGERRQPDATAEVAAARHRQ
jgi:hypothetical protein